MGISNQMLLFQVSKSPIIKNNLLVTCDLLLALLIFSLKDMKWRVRSGVRGRWQVVGMSGRRRIPKTAIGVRVVGTGLWSGSGGHNVGAGKNEPHLWELRTPSVDHQVCR